MSCIQSFLQINIMDRSQKCMYSNCIYTTNREEFDMERLVSYTAHNMCSTCQLCGFGFDILTIKIKQQYSVHDDLESHGKLYRGQLHFHFMVSSKRLLLVYYQYQQHPSRKACSLGYKDQFMFQNILYFRIYCRRIGPKYIQLRRSKTEDSNVSKY